jgi:hypothetical protein
MNNLQPLLNKLKYKPQVEHNVGVKVTIDLPKQAPAGSTTAVAPIIVADKDDGRRAVDILEKIKQRKLSAVTKKFPEELSKEKEKENSAPPLMAEPAKKPRTRKLPKTPIVLVEEEGVAPEEILVNADIPLPVNAPGLAEEALVLEKEKPLEEEIIAVEKPRKRRTKRAEKGVIPLGAESMVIIGDTPMQQRLPPIPTFDVKVSSYYMNNREIFVNFINGLFETYKDDLLDENNDITCEDIGKDTGDLSLLTHQKIVREYMNLYTPYRGLLLFHGLGSGKTCSSIAIAEGMKSVKRVIVMTPASLRRNYIEEIKKCGDLVYRKNQFWEWVSIDDNPQFIEPLSAALGLPVEFITRHHGAWLVNVTKPSNYATLSTSDKKILNVQLDEMIQNKYKFINFNGLRREKFKELTNDFENNIFDNAVVIIDEAHNLISRIVNKINKIAKFGEKSRGPNTPLPISLPLLLYEFLLRAENCKIVLLTGTPVINYPNELAILFNILRGYIKTWSFTLNTESTQKLTKETLDKIFYGEKILDYIDYVPSSKILTITRNPYGFENKISATSGYKGVSNQTKKIPEEAERGTISDEDFIKKIVKILKKSDITAVPRGTSFAVHTALPDTLKEFANVFVDSLNGNITNADKLKRRIIGLTSYFRSAQEELLPAYDKDFNRHAVFIPMSDYQFKVYEDYRFYERRSESNANSKKSRPNQGGAINIDGLFKEPSSSYRIFSRLACNFAMPTPPGRPNPMEYGMVINVKAVKDLQDWYEQEYNKRDIAFNKAEEVKYNKFVSSIPKANFTKYIETIRNVLSSYIEEIITNEYEGTIENIAKQLGHDIIFSLEEGTKAQATEKAQATTKAPATEKAQAKEKKPEEKEKKPRGRPKKVVDGDKAGGQGLSDDDLEDDLEGGGPSSDEEGEVEENPIEQFVDNADDAAMALEGYQDEDANLREIDELEGDELLETMGNAEYKEAVKAAYKYLQLHARSLLNPKALETYSPKYLAMLENIEDPEHQGLHLVYSQFRSMEGLGIFSLTLEANGFARFKIKRNGLNEWVINMSEEDMGKPCYALYTGTEGPEEREIIRNIYNGTWDYIPNNIAAQLKAKSTNNNMGEIIKILMITSAGSEGINLRNTRYVHIMEPYWHPVRAEQVIGRARRICSHQSLPKALQTVDVFIYIMTFTKSQIDSDYAIELRVKDASKLDRNVYQTSDEKLYEISNIKERLTTQLLTNVKEAAIDCATHIKSSTKEGLTCLSFGSTSPNEFSYNPNYSQDENDAVASINQKHIEWDAVPFTQKTTGKTYMLRQDTKQVYDYNSVLQAQQNPKVRPILIGRLVKNALGGYEIVKE